MVASMTGYGNASFEVAGVPFSAEIRTLNHRYLDIHCRLPDMLTALEMPIRAVIKKFISRGRVDVQIAVQHNEDSHGPDLNIPVYRTYSDILRRIMAEHNLSGFDPVAMLSLPDILSGREVDAGAVSDSFIAPLENMLRQLCADRKREGVALWRDLLERAEAISTWVDQLKDLARQQQDVVAQRFRQRLLHLHPAVDDNRLLTEIAVLVDKVDISEELVRLSAHLEEFISAGDRDEPVGRRLEFLGQEMLREVNTIASKSALYQISSLVVDIKSELEKIREQVQNIE